MIDASLDLSTLKSEIVEMREAIHQIQALLGPLSLDLLSIERRLDKNLALPALPEPPKVPDPVKVEPSKIELIINDEWKRVLELMADPNVPAVFITGEAGTGKSTLTNYFVNQSKLRIAIVAPTGVAALRVEGETIHRFFHFGAHALTKDDIKVATGRDAGKYRNLDILIVDEASMVRADMMDAIDAFMRLNGKDKTKPFGGCKLLLVGDLFQLPPVSKDGEEQRYLVRRYGTATPYFFHAECWRDNPIRIVELTTIFRQKDPAFTGALNAIRRGLASDEQMKVLNDRVNRTFNPPAGETWITLTTTNASVDVANRQMLAAMSGPSRVFRANIMGDFNAKDAPTDEELELKAGMPVMFVRNSKEGLWVNGTLGKVVSIDPLKVEANGQQHDLEPEIWEKITYVWDDMEEKLTKQMTGKFEQIPLRPAAAITIHKSQGLTLERAIIDLASGAFAAGQLYVGLSRLTSLEGMILRRPIQQRDLITSAEVQAFMRGEPIARPAPAPQPSLFVFGAPPEGAAK